MSYLLPHTYLGQIGNTLKQPGLTISTLPRDTQLGDMNSPPRNTIACGACARLKAKCDREVCGPACSNLIDPFMTRCRTLLTPDQIPCSRCASRDVPCEPRYTRRKGGSFNQFKPSGTIERPRLQHRASGGPRNRSDFRNITPETFFANYLGDDVPNPLRDASRNIKSSMPGLGFEEAPRFSPQEANHQRSCTCPSLCQHTPAISLDIDPLAMHEDDFSPVEPLKDLFHIDTGQHVNLSFSVDEMNFGMSTDHGRPLTPGPESIATGYDPSSFGLIHPTLSANTTSNGVILDTPVSSASLQGSRENFDTAERQRFQSTSIVTLSDPSEKSSRDTGCQSSPTSDPRLEPHVRHTPRAAFSDQIERDHVRESREHWSAFRCHDFETTSGCPKTAGSYIYNLAQVLSDQDSTADGWSAISEADERSRIDLDSISESTRDKILVFAQRLLHKALHIRRNRFTSKYSAELDELDVENEEIIFLPDLKALEHFIQIYLRCFEPTYPSVSSGILPINDLVRGRDAMPSVLLLLLMVALGSMKSYLPASQYLTDGLAEVCRIGLIDVLERNMDSQWDMYGLRSALLFVLLAAWSGDKWRMDVSCPAVMQCRY